MSHAAGLLLLPVSLCPLVAMVRGAGVILSSCSRVLSYCFCSTVLSPPLSYAGIPSPRKPF